MVRNWEEQRIRSMIRVARTNKLIEAACLLALGVVLFIWSGTAIEVMCKTISAVIAIIGLVIVIALFFERRNFYGTSVGLFGGVVLLVMGMYLFFTPELLAALIPTIIGLIILLTGLVDLSEAIHMAHGRPRSATAAVVIAALEIIAGVLFVIHPEFIENFIMKFMAVILILDGISDIWVMTQIGAAAEPLEAMADVAAGRVVDADVRPLNPEGQGGRQEEPPHTTENRPKEEKEHRGLFHSHSAKKGQESAAQDPEAVYTTIPRAGKDADQQATAAGNTPTQEMPGNAATGAENNLNGIAQDAADAGVGANKEQ